MKKLMICILLSALLMVGIVNAITEIVEGDSPGGRPSIALDTNGFIHISHWDSANEDLSYCNNTEGFWSCIVLDNRVNFISSIAIDSNDKIHIAYAGLDLKYCNNTNGWNCATIDAINTGEGVSIAIDSNDKIHISYADDDNHALKYCNNTDGSWNCDTLDIGGGSADGYDNSIAIDSNNRVHISYLDFSRGSSDLKYCTDASGSWNCEIADATLDSGRDTSIAVDLNDKIHISYYEAVNDDLKYCTGISGSWNCEIVDSISEVGRSTSIATDKNNNVHISHFNIINFDLRYCNNVNDWDCIKLEGGELFSAPDSINGRGLAIKKGRIVDSTEFSNSIHISWINTTNLMYTTILYPVPPPTVFIRHNNIDIQIPYTYFERKENNAWVIDLPKNLFRRFVRWISG